MNGNSTAARANALRFDDLLKRRRNENDISWVIRNFRPKPTHIRRNHRSCTNPLEFKYKVLTDPNINAIVRQTYPNEPAAHCFQRINDMLAEIGCARSLNVVRCLGFVLIKILKKVTNSVFINETKLLEIRSNMGQNPVVLVPNHRSYADFILLAFVCFCCDIEIPVVVAAVDFYAMFGVASLLRQCGAMYMRRSFKNDRVYQAVFKKYVQTVINESQSPFEFFIEGGRSRCGKSLMPKLGILKMILEEYAKRTVEDITFVPISINFDRLMEDSLFVREVIGIPKPKESTTGLLKGLGLLEQQYGNIYINVGDEISLKEFHAGNRDGDVLSTLAHTIVRKQQDNIILTYFNVLSTVIIHYLMREDINCLSIMTLVHGVTNLKNILIAFGVPLHWTNDEDELKHALGVHEFLKLDESGESLQLPCTIDRGSVREDLLDIVKPVICLQHYSNPCYHFLVSAACLVLILSAGTRMKKDDLFLKYRFFRLLFKHEFVFYEAFVTEDFDNAYNTLQRLNVVEETQNDGLELSDQSNNGDAGIWFSLMLPYLRGYAFVYQSLMRLLSRKIGRQKFTKTIQKRLELALELSEDLSLCYALSSHLISCACYSLVDAGVLHVDGSTDELMVVQPERLKAAESFVHYLLRESDCSISSPVILSANKL